MSKMQTTFQTKTQASKMALLALTSVLATSFYSATSFAADTASIAAALRLSNTITGGSMPTNSPLFTQMVSKVAANDVIGAASIAANSNYFASYLARRMALEMQIPSLDPTSITDNDASAFLIAHFSGSSTTRPSLSTIWSENATYMVNVAGTPTHMASLTPAQIQAVNWSTDLVQVAGQKDASGAMIPSQHVGGYVTLSDRVGDTSFASYGATAGTNLRYIEGIWEISTGMTLVNFESTQAVPSEAPRFVPEYNPNFFHGQGQTACIACHGGGLSSLTHGYATVADVFDFDPKAGFKYIAAPTTATMKSLGSDPTLRTLNATCNLVKNPAAVCNPDSAGAGTTNSWDVGATWSQSGVLSTMGWTGPTTGQGLNALGSALGQATVVYTNFATRLVSEICPMGTFSTAQVAQIAAAANPYATPAGTDDIRTMVALIASNASCQ